MSGQIETPRRFTAMPFISRTGRDDGHGLSTQAVQAFEGRRSRSLIVTVDTGSTAVDEVRAAKGRQAIDTIITDHHLLDGELPDAVALVNPQSDAIAAPLTGAGVAFKLAQAVFGMAGIDMPFDLLSLAALGTIGDSAPLTGETASSPASGSKSLAAHGIRACRRSWISHGHHQPEAGRPPSSSPSTCRHGSTRPVDWATLNRA